MQQIEIALQEAKEQIMEERSLYLSNEQAVRAQLIEPILTSLGWKTTSNKFVRHNAPNDEGKIPDYTLLKDNKNILIVEAKNLSVTLTDTKIISQLSGYCYSQGVDFGILTNGARWLLFNTFQKNPQDRIVWQVDLEREPIETISRKLSSFTYQSIDSLDNLIQTGKALEENWNHVITSKNSIINIISQSLLDNIKRTNPAIRINQSEMNSFTASKLSEYFDVSEGDDEEDSKIAPSGKIKETALTEVQANIFRQRTKPREKISVTFPDGTIIKTKKVVDTFLETIRKIGVEEVRALHISRSSLELISPTKYSGSISYAQHKVGSYWVMVTISTPEKFKVLEEINRRLNLNLRLNTHTE